MTDGTKRTLCIFASYEPESVEELTATRLDYVRALAPFFTEVHVVTNHRVIANAAALPANATLHFSYNQGLDFGLWFRHIQTIHLLEYDRVALVNDSCCVVGSFAPVFAHSVATSGNVDFWGLTDSEMLAYHIQSYFLVFEKRAIPHLLAFVRTRDISRIEDKVDVISGFEVNLTTSMAARHLRISVVYPWRTVFSFTVINPAGNFSAALAAMGCPVIKRHAWRAANPDA